MGWDYCEAWTTKDKVIGAIRKDLFAAGFDIMGEAVTDDGLWVAATATHYDAVPFLVVYLLESDGDMWGFKAIEEEAGPYAVCPKHLLDMVPPVNHEFRARCAEVK